MSKPLSISASPDRADRTIIPELAFEKKVMVPGSTFKITGNRGTFVFRFVVVMDSGESWIECIDDRRRSRSFDLDRVRKVVKVNA